MKFFKNIFLYLVVGWALLNYFVVFTPNLFYVDQAFIVAYLLIVPGFLLLPFLTNKRLSFPLGIAFSTAGSIFLLMLLGLAMNTALPILGILKPLSKMYLLPGFDILMGCLFTLIFLDRKSNPIALRALRKESVAAIVISSFFPLLACMGAISLNNGGSNFFIMLALFLVAVMVILVTWKHKNLDVEVFPIILYSMALTFLLMNSMRGWYITGHDVHLEYNVFNLTNTAHLWDMSFYQDPYMACLSITILPTFVQNLLHTQDFYIYKFFFEFIGAMPVVVIYYLSRQYTTRMISFFVGFLFISFPTFMTDMSMLNRQSIAFLFFCLFIFTMLTTDLFEGRTRKVLLFLLGIGIILSHYSTSYVTIALLVSAYIVNRLLRLIMLAHRPRIFLRLTSFVKNKEIYVQPILLSLPLVIGLLIVSITWSAVITKTSKGITDTLQKIVTSVENPVKEDDKTGAAKYNLGQTKQLTKEQIFSEYVANNKEEQKAIEAKGTTADLPVFYPKSITDKYQAVPVDEPIAPLTSFGKGIVSMLHLNFYDLYNNIKQSYAKVMQVVLFLGLLGMLIGYAFKKNVIAAFPPEYISLATSGLIVIIVQTVLPVGAIDYGLLRLFQQNLVLLALPICLSSLWIISLVFHKKQAQLYVQAFIMVTFFLLFSGFVPQLTGGGRPGLPLNNSGFYYDAYFTHAEEFDAFKWIKNEANPTSPIQSDRYFSSTKMIAYSGIAPEPKLLPETIRRDAFVYLSYKNVHSNDVIEYVNGDVLYYNFNFAFLDDNKDLLYSNGGSKIYK